MADFVPSNTVHTVVNRVDSYQDGSHCWIVWSRDEVHEVISPSVARFRTSQQLVETGNGKAIARVREYWRYHWIGEGPSSDICWYCGHDNGFRSEGRNGFDCGSCGSN
jgi:hypothetical protein